MPGLTCLRTRLRTSRCVLDNQSPSTLMLCFILPLIHLQRYLPQYGSTVASSAIQVRQAFIRKVYSVLFAQICATTIIGASLRQANAQIYIVQHTWVFWLPLVGSIISMLALFYKRQSYPANVALLSLFTVFESFSVGSVVTFYDSKIVLQAMIITSFVFLVCSILNDVSYKATKLT